MSNEYRHNNPEYGDLLDNDHDAEPVRGAWVNDGTCDVCGSRIEYIGDVGRPSTIVVPAPNWRARDELSEALADESREVERDCY